MNGIVFDQRPHLAAIQAAIKAHFGPNGAFNYGEVPGANGNTGTLPNIFALVQVERAISGTHLLSGNAAIGEWRTVVRGLGRTVLEAEWALAKIHDALNEQRLTVGSMQTTQLQHGGSEAPAFDDGRYVGWHMFTYSAA